ncbi:MAG: hypothetical protein ABR875_00475 [Minisyncoccia bacterium]
MKINIKFNKAISAGLLAFTLLSLAASSANAMNLLGSNGNQSDSSVAFIGANNSVVAQSQTDTQTGSVIVSDNFLLATNSPVKNAKPVATKKTSYSILEELTVPVTGYSSTPDQTDASPFIAADGAHVYDGMVAANFLPFGTKIKIPEYFGDKVFTVEDRMNKRYNQKIDIWFPDRESALEFGSHTLEIQIVGS